MQKIGEQDAVNILRFFGDVRLRLGCHIRDGFADCPVSRYVEVQKGHGRLEERRH